MTEDKGLYNQYTLDTPEPVVRKLFQQRHGAEPESVFKIIICHWPGKDPWGYICAGPVPQQGEDGQG